MKTLKSIILLSGILMIALSGCQEKIVDKYMANVPVYMDRKEFKNAVVVSTSDWKHQKWKLNR